VPDRPVLFLAYAGVLGGAERVLLDTATRLGRPVLVACPDGPLAAEAERAGIAVERLPPRALRARGIAAPAHALALAGLARSAPRLVRARAPEVLVAWGARAVLAAALLPRRGGPPRLAVHHDLPPSRAVAAALRAASARAGGAAASSHAIAASLGLRGAAILHPGVDLERFAASPLPAGPPSAVVLGALVPWKRADLALDVAARVPELRLTLAGAPLPGDDPSYVAALRRQAGAAGLDGRVAFVGALVDPRPALRDAHVLLHCADAEPYGLALVEALASGRPVVAPAAAGPLEIVGDGAGRLYPPGDADAAAAALRTALADPAAPAAARARAEARFDVEASVARFRAALDALPR
jgi:glycosyltransferase involved in cell wall biosynthesis